MGLGERLQLGSEKVRLEVGYLFLFAKACSNPDPQIYLPKQSLLKPTEPVGKIHFRPHPLAVLGLHRRVGIIQPGELGGIALLNTSSPGDVHGEEQVVIDWSLGRREELEIVLDAAADVVD